MRRKKILDDLGNQTLDLNSLIDIVFILLIFTMLSMQLGRVKTLELDIPELKDSSKGIKKENVVEIHLNEKGELSLEGKLFSLRDESESNTIPLWYRKLNGYPRPISLLILVDKKVYYDDFLYLLKYIQEVNPEFLQLGYK